MRPITREEFLKLIAALALTPFASACSSPTAPSEQPQSQPRPQPIPPQPSPQPGPVGGWASLSNDARQFIISHNLNLVFPGSEVGVVKRWNSFPIAIWADANLARADLEAATGLWQQATNGKISFRIVTSASEARIVVDSVWPPPPSEGNGADCGGGNVRSLQGNVIVSGFVHVSLRAQCVQGENRIRHAIAHELGHVLGLGGHTPSGDIMDRLATTWRISPLVSEIINWIYSVPPGTRPA